MNQGNRNCMIVGHQEEYVSFLCSLSECKGPRWLCPICLVEETHRHGRNNNGHIKSKRQILQQYEEKLKELENNQKQQKGHVLNILKGINQQIQDFMKMVMDLQDELKNIVRDSENGSLNQELQSLYSKIRENFFNMNNDEINKILEFNSYQTEKNININYIYYILDQFPQIINNLSQNFIELEESYLKANKIIKNYELRTFFLEQKSNNQIREIFTFVQISSNEQYIAIADNLGSLALKNLASYTQIARTRLEKCVYQCEFSEDLQNLFVACKGGQLYKLNLDLHIVNSYQTDQEVIQSLEIISDSILVSSSSQTIIKLDISNQRELLKIYAGSVNVKYDRVHEMIVGESQKIIYFWNKTGQNIICKENAHELRIIQIQLIQKSQQLLSLDEEGILKMWLINLNTKDLLPLKEFQDLNNRIMSFYSILNDMQIILYQEQGVYIINQKMQQQKKLHKFNGILNYSNNLNIKQSKSVNYIPILSEDYIHVLKASA